MLTGHRGQDDFSESHARFSPSNETTPKRNLHSRKAVKDTRTSEKALQGMGNDESKLEDHGCFIQENLTNFTKNMERNGKQSEQNQIQLGDYCLPPDRKEETLGGIASSKTTEYADPYETTKIMEAFRARGPRSSAPVEGADACTYSLAKSINDGDPTSKSQKDSFRHTYSGGSTQHCTSLSGTSVDSGVEDPDDYDHTITWVAHNREKMAQVLPKTPLKSDVICENSGSDPVAHENDKLYTGSYEDPWDSSGSKQKFENIVQQAKSEYRKKSHSDDYEEPVLKHSDTYEEAWDLKSRESKLENQVQEAHRRMSEGQKNLQRPRKQTYEYYEPWKTPKPHDNPSRQTKKDTPDKLIYSDAYEDPWDVNKRQKEQALEKQFSDALHSPKNRDDVPNFPAPPPPKSQPYEESWDRNQFSTRSPHNSGNSPNQRRQSEGLKMSRSDVAEHIDPDVPLDIQRFYHGKIGRKHAEELLLIHKEGSYLVRRSETQDNVFSLSLKGVGGMPMHLRISLDRGLYILGENSKPFPTVPEMIDHYTRTELPVLKADRIKLLHPIPRDC